MKSRPSHRTALQPKLLVSPSRAESPRAARRGIPLSDCEAESWYERYEAFIADYNRMAEKRAERTATRRAQRKRDRGLRRECEEEANWLRMHPDLSPVERYVKRHSDALAQLIAILLTAAVRAGDVIGIGFGLRLLRNGVSRIFNRLETKLKRQLNYAPSGRRDIRSAAEIERCRIRRRTTTSPEPTADDIRRAWLDANSSCTAIIAFGAHVHDLECYVDNRLSIDEDGVIVGRNAGILGWLRRNTPELACRYKTIMRYKSIAKRSRQFLALKDPEPLDPSTPALAELLAGCPATQKDILARLDAALNAVPASVGATPARRSSRQDGR